MDIIMLITFIPTFISGVVLYVFLPEAGRFSGQAVFLGLPRQVWIVMHDRWGIIFSIVVILHLLLHWKFFRFLPACFRKSAKEECKE